MAERFKAPVLKTGMGASPSGVRIPLPPLTTTRHCLGLGQRFHRNDQVQVDNELRWWLADLHRRSRQQQPDQAPTNSDRHNEGIFTGSKRIRGEHGWITADD